MVAVPAHGELASLFFNGGNTRDYSFAELRNKPVAAHSETKRTGTSHLPFILFRKMQLYLWTSHRIV